jgi:hypothetical protein
MTEAEVEVTWLQGQKCVDTPETERRNEGSSSDAFRECTALLAHSFWTSGLQDYERLNFCCSSHKSTAICYGNFRK